MASGKGFIYYSVDTNRYQDLRIKRLKKDRGCAGLCVYDYILCEIYRVKGCFIQWDANTAFDVADYFGIEEETVTEIVQYCCSIGLFDEGLLSRTGNLSSQAIQTRFLEWSKKAKRVDAKLPEECTILPEEMAKLPETSGRKGETSGSFGQSKVKESKVKESTQEEEEKSDFEKIKSPLLNPARENHCPTWKDVYDTFNFQGHPDKALLFFERHESNGWRNTRGQPIQFWQSKVSEWISNALQREVKDTPPPKEVAGMKMPIRGWFYSEEEYQFEMDKYNKKLANA